MTFWNFFFLLLIYVPLILLWLFTLSDLTKRTDISGLAKGLWAVAVVFLPVIGMLIYFLTRPDDADGTRTGPMAVPAADVLSDADVAELEKIRSLRDSGAITDEESATMKQRVLG